VSTIYPEPTVTAGRLPREREIQVDTGTVRRNRLGSGVGGAGVGQRVLLAGCPAQAKAWGVEEWGAGLLLGK
jgi:hypothetical protein